MSPLGGPVLTAAGMRAAEITCGVSLANLMERAGAALADAAWRFGKGAPVLIMCGPGNNGGDGYVAARLLAEMGVAVTVATFGEPCTELSRQARARWHGPVCNPEDAEPASVTIDALFGTGLSRHLDPDIAAMLRRIRVSSDLVIAADLPSGTGSDDGADLGAVAADITIAFGAAKPAHLLQPAAAKCGHVLVADIGCPVGSNAAVLARPHLPAPGPDDHKYTRGMVAVLAGEMAGAATLAVTAAARCSGYAILAGEGRSPSSVVSRSVASVIADPKIGAMLIGPGMGDNPENRQTLRSMLTADRPLVLDAGALSLVSAEQLRRAPATIVTPHGGEFDRLFGAWGGSKLERARAAAAASGATVIFKGSDTVIASPDGRVTLCPPASTWLATAGTGDVLAGIAVAMLARGLDGHQAAAAAVWLHGDAAWRAGAGLIADDLPDRLSAALAACT